MRSSAALVYNCKQARIVLAGTSFATTETLAFPRSAELERSFKNTVFEDVGVQNISRIKIYRTTIIYILYSEKHFHLWPALAEDKIGKNPNNTNNEQKTLRFILLKHIFLFYLQQSCEFRSNISVWKVTIRLQMPEIRKEK